MHELDAASNNGVENIRELIERASYTTAGRHKVYILDEVHMLSRAAEAALLKTLEEPPPHVVFVLATTDPQKVSPTIRSRTQHLEFHLLPAEELEAYVRWIAADAGLEVTDDAVEAVVRMGAGSARDTLSALDQVVAAGGVAPEQVPLDELVEGLIAADSGRALAALAVAVQGGRDPRGLAEELIAHLRDGFLSLVAPELVQLPDRRRDVVRDQADRLGLPATVRAIEVLGEMLVELRHAPGPEGPARRRAGPADQRRRRRLPGRAAGPHREARAGPVRRIGCTHRAGRRGAGRGSARGGARSGGGRAPTGRERDRRRAVANRSRSPPIRGRAGRGRQRGHRGAGATGHRGTRRCGRGTRAEVPAPAAAGVRPRPRPGRRRRSQPRRADPGLGRPGPAPPVGTGQAGPGRRALDRHATAAWRWPCPTSPTAPAASSTGPSWRPRWPPTSAGPSRSPSCSSRSTPARPRGAGERGARAAPDPEPEEAIDPAELVDAGPEHDLAPLERLTQAFPGAELMDEG